VSGRAPVGAHDTLCGCTQSHRQLHTCATWALPAPSAEVERGQRVGKFINDDEARVLCGRPLLLVGVVFLFLLLLVPGQTAGH